MWHRCLTLKLVKLLLVMSSKTKITLWFETIRESKTINTTKINQTMAKKWGISSDNVTLLFSPPFFNQVFCPLLPVPALTLFERKGSWRYFTGSI